MAGSSFPAEKGNSLPAHPAVLVVGDLYLLEDRAKALQQQIQNKIQGEVFFQSFRLTETPLDQIIPAARNLPFLTAFQCFRIQEAQALKEKKLESLAEYLENPSKTTALIFEAISLDKDHALVKLLSKTGQVIFLEAADKKTAGAKLVREKIRRAGKTLAPGVLERLEDQAADAPAFIDTVMDQLLLYAANQTQITEEMLDKFQENWKEPNIFTLTDALIGRRQKEALICLKQILEQDEKEIIPLLGLLHWQIRRFWQAKTLLEEGMSQAEISKRCKISPRQAPFFFRQLQAVSKRRLDQALEGLFKLDWNLKTGRSQGAVDLERWVLQTTGS